MTEGFVVSVVSDPANYAWGGGAPETGPYVKSNPRELVSGQAMPPGEIRRVMFSALSTKAWSSSNNTRFILGRHETRSMAGGSPAAGTINEGSSIGPYITAANGYRVWIKPISIVTLEDGEIDVTGQRVIADGTEDGSAAIREQLTIDGTTGKVYVTENRYTSRVDFDGDDPGVGTMNVTLEGGIVDPWNHGGFVRVMEALYVEFRPSASTWRFDWTAYAFRPEDATYDASDGMETLVGRTFQQSDSPTRAQNGVAGSDFHGEINAVVDPTIGEGFVIAVNMKSIDHVALWASFYEG